MLRKRIFGKIASQINWLKVPLLERLSITTNQKKCHKFVEVGWIKWSLDRLHLHINYPLSFSGTESRQPFII